ncbi:MAG: hypothetical protein Q8K79_22250 [Solirubrobacteraceae bacterium]|nr:hypothetical protein [Solirubrobacteraceae bacterium]
MLFDELVAKVGAERYREACERAWATAAGTGRCGGQRSWAGDLQAVAPQFADAWWHGDASLRERLETALRLYAEMPCYANTVALHGFLREFGEPERRMLWDAVRTWLGDEDDRLADPIAHSLWVDFFEDDATVQEAWGEVTRRDHAPWQRRLARVLQVCGPVPWALKAQLLDELARDPDTHHAVLRAIAGSAFDPFGDLGPGAAALLARLDLPADTPDLAALRARLALR